MDRNSNTIIAIVVPCYNEQEVLPETNQRLTTLLEQMVAQGQVDAQSSIVYVDDGSSDATWQLITQYHQDTPTKVHGVKLAANAGHQNALMAGMMTTLQHVDAIITIDADLQDDINAIPQMVDLYHKGCDIVYGVRRNRDSDSLFKRTTAKAFYRLMQKMGIKSVYNHADFRLMSQRAVNALCQYHEQNLFLRGIVPRLGYRTSCVYYDREARQAGQSKYPLKKMIAFAADGITSFSARPLHIILWLGIAFLLIALIMLCYVIIAIIMGRDVQGWASLMVSIWFVGGCVLVSLSVIAEYVGKIYIEAKQRPRYNIESTLGIEQDQNPHRP